MKKLFTIMTLSSLLFVNAASAQTATSTTTTAPKVEKPVAKKAATSNLPVFKGKGSRSKAMFSKMDTDKNGKISKSEFNAAHAMKFDKKDKNKDGELTPEEFSKTLYDMKNKKS